MKSSLAILVSSCDKYSDLWPTLESSFNRYWPDCSYPKYLHANEITSAAHPDSQFNVLSTGRDRDWSTDLKIALSKLDHEYLLIWIDDAFLKSEVDHFQFDRLVSFVSKNRIDGLRLRKNPRLPRYGEMKLGEVPENTPYRQTVFGMIWKKDSLALALKNGESPWDFEVLGSYRNPNLKICSLSYDFFQIHHGVIGGKWIRGMKTRLVKQGYLVPSEREEMSLLESITSKIKLFKAEIFHLLPFDIRNRVLRNRWNKARD